MPERYPRLLICLHWLTFVAVIAAVGLGLGHEWTDDRQLRGELLDLHRQLGLLVFVATAMRLLGRSRPRPALPPLASGAQQFVARATHGLLYLLLAGLPLLGLIASQAGGHAVKVLGLTLPSLIARDRDLAEQLVDIHEYGAWTLLALAGVHALAALWHHYVLKDGALRRMLPLSRFTRPTD